MSYQEQADKMNKRLKELYAQSAAGMTTADWHELINLVLWYGQVAKFRCRSNAAYDNYARAVFRDLAEIQRAALQGQEFEVLQVKEVSA